MKSLKTKVIMSAVVLVFALIATIGSTYAWFTVSTEVTVSGLELDVQSDESLLILIDDSYVYSTPGNDDTDFLDDASNYGITLTNSDITSTSKYSGMGSWTIGTVTAAFGNTDGVDLTYTGLVNAGAVTLTTMAIDGKTKGSATSNTPTGDYIVIDFWLLSQSSTPEDIVLQDLQFAGGTGNSTGQDTVTDALRLSTHVSGGTDLVFATDPDYDFAFTSGNPGYDLPAGLNSLTAGVITALEGDHSLFYDSGTPGDGADTSLVDTATITTADVITTLASNTPTKVSVSIYIEGWDLEANTDILNAAFLVSFKFALQDTV